MNKTSIEWTENTWNPITGCTQISDGCKNCYAKRMAKRLKAMGNPRYVNEFRLTIHEDLFSVPLLKKKPQVIFVCSMSDLFHEDVSFEVIKKIFEVMIAADWHVFQVLTKRADRLLEYSKNHLIPDNVWVGTSVENSKVLDRIDSLKEVKAKTKFLSCEPLLGPLYDMNLEGVDWVVVGGESGPKSRPVEKEWVVDIKEKCETFGAKFFFKQWGGFNKKKNGRVLDGEIYNQMPKLPEVMMH